MSAILDLLRFISFNAARFLCSIQLPFNYWSALLRCLKVLNFSTPFFIARSCHSSGITLLRLRLAARISLLPLPLRFRTLLYLHVNLIKEIRVAITISPSCKFQWESWITWSCNCCLSLYVFYKFLGEPVMANPQFHPCNPSIIFCQWNDAKRRYPNFAQQQ